MHPSIMVPIALFGWVPLALALFYLLPARWAVIASYVGAWLFLPMYGYSLPLIPTYDKTAAATLAVLLGAVIFDFPRLLSFRPRLVDLIVVVFTIAPLISSVTNGLGLWDGLSEVFKTLMLWGLVYFVGRLYIDSPQAMRDLAIGIVIGGLVYMPLCLFEIRMSPQLHRMVYGFSQMRSFVQVHRGGGFRPVVFMQHGLMVADWMMAATVGAFWLWITGSLKRLWLVPMWACFGALLVTTVLCKSTGALALLGLGLAVLGTIRLWPTPWPLVGLATVPVIYIALSGEGMIPYDTIQSMTAQTISQDRAASLGTRFDSERILVNHATDSLLFGWGGHGRWKQDRFGDELDWGADQLWVITFAWKGLVGLVSLVAMLSIPAVMCCRRLPRRAWTLPQTAPMVGLAVILALYHIDCLFNAMLNPVFVLIIGAAASFPAIKLVAAPTPLPVKTASAARPPAPTSPPAPPAPA